jgi:hypothetical protein
MNTPQKAKRCRRKKEAPVTGVAAPTTAQVALMGELARRWRFDLPRGYTRDLDFVRAFLDVFALDRKRNPPEQVLRRLRVARAMAFDGATAEEIVRKLDVPACLASVIYDYAKAQVPRRWADKAGDDGTKPPLDVLSERAIEDDDSVWKELEALGSA